MSKTIEEIILLLRVMVDEFKDVYPISVRRNRAVEIVSELYSVKPATIRDKYSRRLGINTDKFDDLLAKLFESGNRNIFQLLRRHSDAKDQVAIDEFERYLQSKYVKIAPSILSADFARLGEQVVEATEAGAHYIHIDVMDGHFVPPITIGPVVVKAIRPLTNLPFDVHLMVEKPERQIEQFAEAGADIITVHAEVCPNLHQIVESIKGLNVRAGVSLNPATSLNAIEDVLANLDLVLVMTVNPGYAGQAFMEEVLDKIAHLREILDDRGLKAELEVDGGITVQTAPKVVQAGARVLVAGSALFNSRESVGEAMDRLKASLGSG